VEGERRAFPATESPDTLPGAGITGVMGLMGLMGLMGGMGLMGRTPRSIHYSLFTIH